LPAGLGIFKDGNYTVIKTEAFQVAYDGVQYLKLRVCRSSQVCGLCSNKAGTPSDYLIVDRERRCLKRN
jgi:hypothetical protein